MATLLEVDDIHTYYGNIQALKGISLTVEEGECVTLIGSNGAGKSTTPRSSRSLRMKLVSAADSCGFMPAVGSSSSSTLGSEASARAISTRRDRFHHRSKRRRQDLPPEHDLGLLQA